VLYEKIAAIDGQLKQSILPASAALDEAEALLRDVMREIDGLAAIAPQAPLSTAVPLAAGAVRALLARLALALEYDLGAAESVLAELRTGVAGTPLESEVTAVGALVDDFDIDPALAQLKQLEDSLSEKVP
jgi:two-component system sensor histidine kinase/response regulator